MADVSGKLAQAFGMVEKGAYFIINRPRQYGKTTTLYTLADMLRKTGEYIVFNTSFEGVGDSFFSDEEAFSGRFVELLADYAQHRGYELADWLNSAIPETRNLQGLSKTITQMVERTDKKVVLMIDEVDKSSNNQLFVSFLAMLRNKYLAQDDVKTFHSVVLAGVHDVKSLKLKLRPDEEQKYNSPWNIAADFTVDMNLQPAEIAPMLREYAADKNVALDAGLIADRLFYYTSGYPFLVSKLCKIMDERILPEKTDRSWTEGDVEMAVNMLVHETNTNFDSLIKNLENDPKLYQFVYGRLFDVESHDLSIHDPMVAMGLMFGIFKNGRGISIHNRIYEAVIYDYMTSKANSHFSLPGSNVKRDFSLPDNTLNMELVLLKFQAFMREQHSGKDKSFLERNGRLVFLAFIKPIINGAGHDFKETQISEERRLDVVITYLQHKYVAELKIWHGKEAHAKGLAQLADYLDRLSLNEGYLVIFDHSKRKTWKSGWEMAYGKKIFAVWV